MMNQEAMSNITAVQIGQVVQSLRQIFSNLSRMRETGVLNLNMQGVSVSPNDTIKEIVEKISEINNAAVIDELSVMVGLEQVLQKLYLFSLMVLGSKATVQLILEDEASCITDVNEIPGEIQKLLQKLYTLNTVIGA